MTRIALAYEFEGHSPDDVIDLDAAVAKQLIRDGKARPVFDDDEPSGPAGEPDVVIDLTGLTVRDLKKLAAEHGIDISPAHNKPQLQALVTDALAAEREGDSR